MQTADDFLARHSDADHRYLARVRAALANEEYEAREPHSHALGEGFIGIHERRAENLALRRAPHARQLEKDVRAWVDAAKADIDVETWWWRFELPQGRTVAFFERKRDFAILGALMVVSKLAVTPAEWRELWWERGDA